MLSNKRSQLAKTHYNAELEAKLAEETIDVSLPGRRIENGGLHPVRLAQLSVSNSSPYELGFNTESGPEIEDAFHNFDALNIADDHPARTDHDTFFFNPDLMLRTHTWCSNPYDENGKPPFRFIAPGRVYRNDYDQTHTPMFHQVEGMLVDENVNFAQLKGILNDFLCNFFEEEVEVVFRPSFFPFTEPSAEVDVKRKDGKWPGEVLGCRHGSP